MQDYDRLTKCFKTWYGVNLEAKEHAIRGWNWGKAEFTRSELSFTVQSRPAFEIPFSEIANTNLAGKNEISVDLALSTDENDTGTNGHLGGARARGKKSGAAKDQLVELRFYIPGTAEKTEVKEEGEEEGEGEAEKEGEEKEEQSAANLFYQTLLDKADIGEVAGTTFATFLDILHLTPRYLPAVIH